MEKKFFAKYLPVEGEVKEGDRFFSATNEVILVTMQHGADLANKNRVKKVKLFLCSRDIQVGDKDIYAEPQAMESHQKGLRLEVVSIEDLEGYKNAKIKYLANPKRPDCVGNIRDWPAGNLWKVIGEVSKEVTWVKEGMEFSDDEVACIYEPGEDMNTEYVLVKDTGQWIRDLNKHKKKGYKYSLSSFCYAIKCPHCGKF